MSHNFRRTVRASALAGLTATCARFGVDAKLLLRQAGLPLDVEADLERRLPVLHVNALLEAAAAACGRPDFALQLAQPRGFSNLGPVGLLARDEPSAGAAMTTIAEYMAIHNDALELTVEAGDDSVTIRAVILVPPPNTQAHELTVAMIYRIIRQLTGPDWHPELISLSRPRPADVRGFGAFFGQRPMFDAGFDGVTLSRASFDLPNRFADPAFHQLTLRSTPHGAAPHHDSMAARVRRILPILIANQRCTADHVASRLGVSRRTLTRQLAAEDLNFLQLLDDMRDDIVRQQLAQPGRKLADIADTLGFSSPAAFSGWFRRRHGASPRDWRRANATV